MHLFSPRHSSNKFGSALGYRKRSPSYPFSHIGITPTNPALPSAFENVHYHNIFVRKYIIR